MTARVEIDAAPPPQANAVGEAWDRVRHAARAAGRARRALNGERLSLELDRRLVVHQNAVAALNAAIDLALEAETQEGTAT